MRQFSRLARHTTAWLICLALAGCDSHIAQKISLPKLSLPKIPLLRNPDPEPRPKPAVQLGFEIVARPDLLKLTGAASRAKNDTSRGFWAILPELDTAERARITRPDKGADIDVALFEGPVPDGVIALLSPRAADRLGMLDDPVEVEIIALRREPKIAQP